MEINKIIIAGAGTMGLQIALQCASHDYQVSVIDNNPQVWDQARDSLNGYAHAAARDGYLEPDQIQSVLENVQLAADPARAAATADLLIESIPEDLALKMQFFSEFNRLCPPRTVFTTNTSSLVPSMFAEASGRGHLLAALHFHQPVWSANICDVMPHAGTDSEVTNTLLEFARSIGQVPIFLQKESYGYVFNAMYNALNRAAITLAANGIASVEDIDRAWMVVMKMPVGPFGMLDSVGVDTAWHITRYWADALGDQQLAINADFLKSYLDRGRLGVKTQAGFYDYPDPPYARPGFLTGE
jgi:3-hydroxybutyryl-CoA dehydrogenase